MNLAFRFLLSGRVSSALLPLVASLLIALPLTVAPVPGHAQDRAPQTDPGGQADDPQFGGEAAEPATKPPEPAKPYHQRVLSDPPKSPRERAEVLANLYAQLSTATSDDTGKEIAAVIERLWLLGHGDTVFVLMQRANRAQAEKNSDLALKLLDAVVDIAPDYAEGWHQRAVIHYTRNDFSRALGDLRRVLALDANHYKALEGLSRMLEETGNAQGALAAHRQLMGVNPFWPNGEERLRELERKGEGQGI